VGCSIGRGVAVAAGASVGASTGASVAAGAAQAVKTIPPTVIADRRKKFRRLIFSERDILEIPPVNGLEITNDVTTQTKYFDDHLLYPTYFHTLSQTVDENDLIWVYVLIY
jgi:hypothetical protein